MNSIRWRLNDPAQEDNERWTRIHILHPGTAATATGTFGGLTPSDDEVTFCGRTVPEHAYMIDRNDQIPASEPWCRRCVLRAGKRNLL